MEKRRTRLIALIALLSLVSLGCSGALLAFAEGQGCGRACCNLAKSGSVSAGSCCRLNCREEASGPPASNAFEKDSLQRFLTLQRIPSLTAGLETAARQLAAPARESDSAKTRAGQSDLHLKLSLLLA